MTQAVDWAALRLEFPTLEKCTYLDIARKTIPPKCQQQAVESYFRDVYDNAGADAWSADNVALGRAEVAQLLGIAAGADLTRSAGFDFTSVRPLNALVSR